MSIVTQTLNSGRYIEDCLDSVKSQDYPNVEHVIIDGGSTDDTLEILKAYEGSYNVKWVSEPDEGASDAANKGMRVARGELLAILPSDDLLLPWSVSAVVKAYLNNPGVDLIYGDTILMRMGDSLCSLAINPPPSMLRTHLAFGPISFPSVFWTKKLFRSVGGFDRVLQAASDYDFTIRAAGAGRFLKVGRALACYRYRQGSESMKDTDRQKRDRQVINSRHFRGRQGLRPELLAYELRWSVFCTAQLVALLAGASGNQTKATLHSDLVRAGLISRLRLAREIFLAPLIYTNFFIGRRVRHGFLDARRLLQISAGSTAR